MKKMMLWFALLLVSFMALHCSSPDSGNKETVATPKFSPSGATNYAGSLEISILCDTPDAVIMYSTDGSGEFDKLYLESFTITNSMEIKAIAMKSGMNDSAVATAVFTKRGDTEVPQFSPGDGTSYSGYLEVAVSCNHEGSTIFFTLDNSDPKSSGTALSNKTPFIITLSNTLTIRAFASNPDYEDSAVVSAAYTKVPLAAPVFSPGSGSFREYYDATDVTISTIPGATLKYTLDNSDPVTNPNGTAVTVSSSNVTVSVFGTKTIKAIARKAGASDSSVATCEYVIARAPLPETWDYDVYNDVDYTHPGSDIDLKYGVSWPDPRFTVNASAGVVQDNLTGLMWARDVNASGEITWQQGLDYVAQINTDEFAGYTDWRMPNIHELESLANYRNFSVLVLSNAFPDIETTYYWSSTSEEDYPSDAYTVEFGFYKISSIPKSGTRRVVPVRTSGTGVISLAKTGQTNCYDASGNPVVAAGTGQDGELQAGMAWPGPRFTDNGNRTITDNLTGLMWADMFLLVGTDYEFTHSSARTGCNDLSWAGYSDWRLPNIRELLSLKHYGSTDQSSWMQGYGFLPYLDGQWSSTTMEWAYSPGQAYMYEYGYSLWWDMTELKYVQPVRSGIR